MRVRAAWTAILVLGTASLAVAQNDKTRANSYDDAWETGWVNHCRTVLQGGSGKTTGFVLHLGDSITHANPYGQWARYGSGKTAEDAVITAWCLAPQAFPGSPTATDKNGFYLCAVDIANRSMTAAGGVTTGEYLSGSGNGGAAMPSTANTATAQGYVVNTAYDGDLHITTVASAFVDAQIAVLMLGTNDIGAGRSAAAFIADLTSLVNALEARNIVVVLSTIPPRVGSDVTGYNAQIAGFAASRGLPLIDYYSEILLRRPGTAWQGTLISGDGVHPTAPSPSADPYTPGGSPATHRTGDNCLNDGYLLRNWLTVQKLKEVKSYVVDLTNPPAPPPPPPPPTPSGPAVDDDDDDDRCGCGSVESVPAGLRVWLAALAALAALVLVGVRRLQ